jgi:septum formation topological specificity factor MinE
MSTTIDYEKVVPAMLELTDSIIRLLNATSHREGCSKQTITALRTLIVRERRTIQRQSSIIVDLRKRLLDVEEQLVAVQQGLKINADNARESFEEGDEKVDLSVMATLDRLDESPKQEVSFSLVHLVLEVG